MGPILQLNYMHTALHDSRNASHGQASMVIVNGLVAISTTMYRRNWKCLTIDYGPGVAGNRHRPISMHCQPQREISSTIGYMKWSTEKFKKNITNWQTLWWVGRCWHSTYMYYTMTSPNENIFRVTDHLCGEFTGHRWILRTKASDAELWCFLWSAPEWTVELIIVRLVIWDAIAPIMMSR